MLQCYNVMEIAYIPLSLSFSHFVFSICTELVERNHWWSRSRCNRSQGLRAHSHRGTNYSWCLKPPAPWPLVEQCSLASFYVSPMRRTSMLQHVSTHEINQLINYSYGDCWGWMAVDYVRLIPCAIFVWTSHEPINILFDTNVVWVPNGRLDTLRFPISILLVRVAITWLLLKQYVMLKSYFSPNIINIKFAKVLTALEPVTKD